MIIIPAICWCLMIWITCSPKRRWEPTCRESAKVSLAPPPPNDNQHISNLAMTKSRIFFAILPKTIVHHNCSFAISSFLNRLQSWAWATAFELGHRLFNCFFAATNLQIIVTFLHKGRNKNYKPSQELLEKPTSGETTSSNPVKNPKIKTKVHDPPNLLTGIVINF